MSKFQIRDGKSRVQRGVTNAHGSCWSRMQRFMAMSKSWSQEKIGTLLCLILHCSLKWHESASPSQIYKTWKGKKEEFGVTCWLLRPQGYRDSMNFPCSAAGARRRWWTLSPDLGQALGRGDEGHLTSSPGRLVHQCSGLFNFSSCKAEIQKTCTWFNSCTNLSFKSYSAAIVQRAGKYIIFFLWRVCTHFRFIYFLMWCL